MAHINYARVIDTIYTMRLSQTRTNTNFAIFCGKESQRNEAALYQISAVLGKKPIVLIHNNPTLESQLTRIYDINPHIREHNLQTKIIVPNLSSNRNAFYYDPLYGMNPPDVLDAIKPMPGETSPNALQIESVRAALSDYLDIMEYQFHQSSHAFGQYPFNLDLLLELTEMSYETLEENVLQYLPEDLRERIRANLSSINTQQQVHNSVLNFSKKLSRNLFTRRTAGTHPKISIIQSVNDHQLISIYVPSDRTEILDYLSLELKQLNDYRIPYVLIGDNIDLTKSQRLREIFLSEHQSLAYTTGIIASDLSSIVHAGDTNASNDVISLYSQTNEILVYACPSTNSAIPFCENAGNYYRYVRDHHTGTTRAPFHLFPAHSQGSGIHEQKELIVHPEELTMNPDVCLLCGKDHPIPTRVDHFQYNNVQTHR